MIRILAGNYRQAEICARDNKLAKDAWAYVFSADDLRGLHGEHIWLTGTYNFRPDLAEVKREVMVRELVLVEK